VTVACLSTTFSFHVANGSEGHANVYVVKTEKDGTLVITGQIADRSDGVRAITAILCEYRGMRAARRCAKPVPTAYLMALATSIDRPIKCNDVAGQRKPVLSSTVPRRITFMPARALKALWNSGSLIRRVFSHKIVPTPSGPMAR
jgi:hypothetical protein